jgi:MFS family permease
MNPEEKKWMLFYIYLVTFLASIGFALIIYINSSFLQKFISNEYVGAVFSVGSLLTLFTLTKMPRILKRIGHLKMMLGILAIETTAIFSIAMIDFYSSLLNVTTDESLYLKVSVFAILFFLIFSVSAVLLRFSLDLYLEKYSINEETGKNRGIFLTTMNLAIAISPYVVGKILTNGDFWRVYLLSSIIFIPAILITTKKLRAVPDVEYNDVHFLLGLKKIWHNRDIKSIFLTNFLLELFYSLVTIYVPIYMFKIMGFSWENIGTIFSISLISFVVLQLPLGKIADAWIGEKEILTAGLIIAGSSTIAMAFINNPSFYLWATVLFSARVGAAAIEIMNETYFFKKVSSKDSDIISFFRNASPLAYIIGPTTASIIVYFLDFKYLFIILGAVMICGIRYSLAIKDTL